MELAGSSPECIRVQRRSSNHGNTTSPVRMDTSSEAAVGLERHRFRVRPDNLKDHDNCQIAKSLSSAPADATTNGLAFVSAQKVNRLRKVVSFSREALKHYHFRKRCPSTYAEDYGLTNTNRTPVKYFPSEVELRLAQARAKHNAKELYMEVYGSANESVTSHNTPLPDEPCMEQSSPSGGATPLRVGTDCSGMEVPIMAPNNGLTTCSVAIMMGRPRHLSRRIILPNSTTTILPVVN